VTASHPHFYGAMAEWGQAFGADVWVPEADAAWVTRPDPVIRTWRTRLPVLPGVTLVQCGGHFPRQRGRALGGRRGRRWGPAHRGHDLRDPG